MADVYKKYLNKNALNQMKASETTKIREEEESLTIWLIGSVVFGFMWIVLLLAFLLWMNKFTFFLLVTFAILLIPIVWLFFSFYKSYMKMIREINEKYEGVE